MTQETVMKACPSCNGLNLSCPDGCGRDPVTGELNGTRYTPPPVEALQEEDWQTRFWSIVDRDGLTGLPSDEWASLDLLVSRARQLEEARALLGEVATELVEQRDEPWPGPNADRIHYWRDKCIAAARRLNEGASRG